jgi:hypothetical protein
VNAPRAGAELTDGVQPSTRVSIPLRIRQAPQVTMTSLKLKLAKGMWSHGLLCSSLCHCRFSAGLALAGAGVWLAMMHGAPQPSAAGAHVSL